MPLADVRAAIADIARWKRVHAPNLRAVRIRAPNRGRWYTHRKGRPYHDPVERYFIELKKVVEGFKW